MRRVLVYRNELLPTSETFIAAQAGAMRRYDPWFAGLGRVANGIALNRARVTVATENGSLRDRLLRRLYLTSGYAPRFHRELRTVEPTLIHAHFAVDGCVALRLQKKLRAPLIVTLHGYDVTSSDESLRATPSGTAYLAHRRELWDRTRLFICVSEHIRRQALPLGFPEHKLWVHRIGIDLHVCEGALLRDRMATVLFVGRLVEKKGCIHLIRAMAQVRAKLPTAQLVIIGDGPSRASLEREARERSPNTVFLGSQPAAVVRTWMQRARMLVAPSVVAKNGDSEGLPTVLCEAQAMRLPIVAFRGPGVSEAVIDGETALLVDPLDDEGLSAAVIRLLGDRRLQGRLGAAGRLHAEKYFDLQRQTALLEDKYDEVLSGK